jgi:hypothetical protein
VQENSSPVHYLISEPLKQKNFKYDAIKKKNKSHRASKGNIKKDLGAAPGEIAKDDLSGGNVTLYKEFRATKNNGRFVGRQNSSLEATLRENEEMLNNSQTINLRKKGKDNKISKLRGSRSLIPWQQSESPPGHGA